MTEQHYQRLVNVRRTRFYRLLLADDPRWPVALADLDHAWDMYIKTWGL